MSTLNRFLVGVKNNASPELADFFATDGQFIDIFGHVWAVHTDQTARPILRMTIVVVPQEKEWTILLIQVVPVIP